MVGQQLSNDPREQQLGRRRKRRRRRRTSNSMKRMLNRCSSSSRRRLGINSNAKGDIISNNNNNYVLDDGDDFVICEILSRLPVKTLMRFKSVCKRWRSSIQHDHKFHHLHFEHSEKNRLGLFIVTEEPGTDDVVFGHSEYFLSVPTLTKGAAGAAGSTTAAADTLHTTFRERDKLYYEKFLSPVKGLSCLASISGNAVRIYNPSTRQESQWIKTTTKTNRGDTFTKPLFLIGFDPVSKKHKVVCHRTQNLSLGKYATEVLTVGDNSWRRIDEVPPCSLLLKPSLHVNGAIYWIIESGFYKNGEEWDRRVPDLLVAFDLGSEKFRVMPIPGLIIDLPRESTTRKNWCGRIISLLEVDGRLALLRRRNKNTVSMWILFDDHNRDWTEVIITLPFDWVGKETYVRFHTVPGSTSQIMVTTASCDRVLSAYTCNWKNNAFTKVEFGGFPSLIKLRSYSLFTPFAESLFPVNYNH